MLPHLKNNAFVVDFLLNFFFSDIFTLNPKPISYQKYEMKSKAVIYVFIYGTYLSARAETIIAQMSYGSISLSDLVSLI